MKKMRFMLSLLFVLGTLNIWAQAEESKSLNAISGNTVYKNMTIVIHSTSIDGFVYVDDQEQSIWKGQNYYEYQMRNTVSSGDVITVEAWLLSTGGYLNTATVTVPENFKNPRLEIYVQNDPNTISSVGAYIIDYIE